MDLAPVLDEVVDAGADEAADAGGDDELVGELARARRGGCTSGRTMKRPGTMSASAAMRPKL